MYVWKNVQSSPEAVSSLMMTLAGVLVPEFTEAFVLGHLQLSCVCRHSLTTILFISFLILYLREFQSRESWVTCLPELF